MAVYAVGDAEYEIPDNVQGEQLNAVLSKLAADHVKPVKSTPAALVADKSQGDAMGMGRAALQGATFGWADEAGAAVAAGLTKPVLWAMGLPQEKGSVSDLYNENMQQFRTERNAYQQANPIKAAGAEIAGGLAAGIATGGSAPLANMSNAGKALTLAGTGAVQGGIYGAGAADPGDRLSGGAKGAAIGAIAAPVIGGILQGAKTAGNYAVAKLGQTPRDQAVKALRAAAESEGIAADDAVRLLDDLGPEATLADLGENFRALARVASNKLGPVKSTAGKMLNERQIGQQGRLLSAAEQATGANADDFRSTVNLLTAQRSVKAKPLYDAAFSTGINETPELAALLERPSMKSAMLQANKLAADAGDNIDPSNLMKRLHYAKMALDAKYEKLGPKEGTMKRAIMGVKSELLKHMDEASPDYKEARALFAGDSSMLSAADKGKNLFKADFDELAEAVGSMGQSEKELFKLGAMRAVQDKMDAVPMTNDSVKRLLGQPRMVKLLGLAFDDRNAAERFIKQASAENAFTRTRNVVTGNSTTASQLTNADELSGVIQPESILSLMRGDVVGAGLNAVKGIFGKKELSPEMLQQLGGMLLTRQNPQQILSMLGGATSTGNPILFGRGAYNVGAPTANALLNQQKAR